ncbi:MAG TPA: hypothetical protein VEL07_00785 [Planctomycetota bacterium]|nr:hypothetical protein [Planctomycetota bacterium]
MSDAPPAWQVHRRPPPRFMAWAGALALIAGAAGAALMRLLLIEPSWSGPLTMGVAVALAFLLTAARGARASVDAHGVLRYGWGHRPALELDLRDVVALRPVRRGLLAGVGLEIAPERVRFLHRAGPSPRRMRDDRRRLGVDLVLEHLDEADALAIDRLRGTAQAAVPTPPA